MGHYPSWKGISACSISTVSARINFYSKLVTRRANSCAIWCTRRHSWRIVPHRSHLRPSLWRLTLIKGIWSAKKALHHSILKRPTEVQILNLIIRATVLILKMSSIRCLAPIVRKLQTPRQRELYHRQAINQLVVRMSSSLQRWRREPRLWTRHGPDKRHTTLRCRRRATSSLFSKTSSHL